MSWAAGKIRVKTKGAIRVLAIVPSAGMGTRMGTTKKNYLPLLGRPVLARTLDALEACPLVDSVIIAARAGKAAAGIVERYGFSKVKKIVRGGATRQASVSNALGSIDGAYDIILVHDGARPLVTTGIIAASVKAAARHGAAIAAVPVKDTIKEASRGRVKRTIPRDALWSVQTPQAFRAGILISSHRKAREDRFTGTDESSLVERLGIKVAIVEGSYENIKITTREDLVMAEGILRLREGR